CAGQCLLRRRIAGLVFATLLTTGAASASSFVTPEPMTARLGPSMIMVGEPAEASVATSAAAGDQPREAPLDHPFPGGKGSAVFTPAGDDDFDRVSASIIAMANPEPAVSLEHVAAVDKDPDDSEAEQRREFFGPLPTVIRGGVVDNGAPAQAPVPGAPSQSA